METSGGWSVDQDPSFDISIKFELPREPEKTEFGADIR